MNHSDVVEAVKAELIARGLDLNGPCGAFAITKRVAWRLRGEGFGVLQKAGGYGCQENGKLYAVDCVMLPDGTHYDILSDGGGANTPQWNLVAVEGTNEPFKRPEMYRPAIDPGDGAAAKTADTPRSGDAPTANMDDLVAVIREIRQGQVEDAARQERILAALEALRRDVNNAGAALGPLLGTKLKP